MSHGEAQGGSSQHAGLTANFRPRTRDESYTITTFYENALTPRKLFYFFISAPNWVVCRPRLCDHVRLRYRNLPPYMLRALQLDELVERLRIVDIDEQVLGGVK